MLDALSDEQLAELTAQGEDAAFEALVMRYRRQLVGHCAQIVGRADAEEAVQEALLRAYLALSRRHSVQHVGAWLWTIAHNTALNLLRARMARPAARGDGTDPPQPAGDPFERREHLRLVVEAVGSLPERQREALVMRELEGRSYAEIESRLRTSNGAVRQLLNRARAGVRARLGTLTGIEPAFRWVLGSGAAGGNAARIAALTGSCAFTAKLCTSALVPATLGPAVLHPPPPRTRVVEHPHTRRLAAAPRPSAAALGASGPSAGAAPARHVPVSYASPGHWGSGTEAPRDAGALHGPGPSRWDGAAWRHPDERPDQFAGGRAADPSPSPPGGSPRADSRLAVGMPGSSARGAAPASGAP